MYKLAQSQTAAHLCKDRHGFGQVCLDVILLCLALVGLHLGSRGILPDLRTRQLNA